MSDSVQYSNRELSDKAKQLEALDQFAEAANLYKQSYDLYQSSFVTSHYIKCLRKQGKSAEAVEFRHALSKQLLNDSYVHKELSWAIYDVYLKKIESTEDSETDDVEDERQGNSDFQKMQNAAHYILAKAPATEVLLRTRTIFAICSEAKQRGNWQVMYDFAAQLDSEPLSKEQKELNGKKLPSDYQQWLCKMVRSLIELKRYEECIEFAQKGIEQYPREKLFPWWKASAKKALGQAEEAVRELEQVDTRFPKEWYIQRDIADGYVQLQKYDEARVWFYKAASCPGDMKGRYKMLEQMAVLLEHLGCWSESYDHIQLAYLIAEREGWERSATGLRDQIAQFRKRHIEHITSLVDATKEEWASLYRRCQTHWRMAVSISLPMYTGEIVEVREEEKFGFIKRHNDGGNDIYFQFRRLTKGFLPKKGMQVEFEVEKSYDSRKDRESLAAVNIRLAKSSA